MLSSNRKQQKESGVETMYNDGEPNSETNFLLKKPTLRGSNIVPSKGYKGSRSPQLSRSSTVANISTLALEFSQQLRGVEKEVSQNPSLHYSTDELEAMAILFNPDDSSPRRHKKPPLVNDVGLTRYEVFNGIDETANALTALDKILDQVNNLQHYENLSRTIVKAKDSGKTLRRALQQLERLQLKQELKASKEANSRWKWLVLFVVLTAITVPIMMYGFPIVGAGALGWMIGKMATSLLISGVVGTAISGLLTGMGWAFKKCCCADHRSDDLDRPPIPYEDKHHDRQHSIEANTTHDKMRRELNGKLQEKQQLGGNDPTSMLDVPQTANQSWTPSPNLNQRLNINEDGDNLIPPSNEPREHVRKPDTLLPTSKTDKFDFGKVPTHMDKNNVLTQSIIHKVSTFQHPTLKQTTPTLPPPILPTTGNDNTETTRLIDSHSSDNGLHQKL